MREELKLESIRSNLIRQEETIIFSLIERAQFGKNLKIYTDTGIHIPDYNGSFLSYMMEEMERVFARVRRYTAPDEHPFTKNLPEPFLTAMVYDWPIKQTAININDKILTIYVDEIIPLICEKNDDHNYGSACVNDFTVLQALSKRIHYGKYVAESKYLGDIEGYKKLIEARDEEGIMEKLTNMQVEEKLLERVKIKTRTYGQEPETVNPIMKIQPDVISKIYKDFIIPLTKDVEVEYLLQRLD